MHEAQSGCHRIATACFMGLPAAALVKLWLAKKIVVLVAARVRVDTRHLRFATGGLTDNNSFPAAQAYGVRRLYRHVACYDFWKPRKWNMRAHLFTGAGSSSTTGS